MPGLHQFLMWEPGEYDRWLRWRASVARSEIARVGKPFGPRSDGWAFWEYHASEQKHITYRRWKRPTTRLRLMGRSRRAIHRRMRANSMMWLLPLDKRFNW